MLAFKEQNCELTLAEGLEIYLGYLKENNKKIGTDGSDDDYKIWQCHDCTHVGLSTVAPLVDQNCSSISSIGQLRYWTLHLAKALESDLRVTEAGWFRTKLFYSDWNFTVDISLVGLIN